MEATKPVGPESRAFHRALGKRVYQLRKARQLTQDELAQALGVSQQTVFAIELGERRVPVSLVPALTRALNVSCEELLGIKPLRPPRQGRMSPKLERHIETIKQLNRTERRFIMRLAETIRPAR